MTLSKDERNAIWGLQNGWDISGRGYDVERQSLLDKGLIEPCTGFQVTAAGRAAMEVKTVCKNTGKSAGECPYHNLQCGHPHCMEEVNEHLA